MQDRPVCFHCDKKIDNNADMVFEAPCGHDDHSSAVFHPLCLMEWRERRQKFEEFLTQMRERWMNEHEQHRDEEEKK